MLLHKIFNINVPLRQRAYQVLNGGLELLLSKSLNLVHVVEYPKCGGSWVRNMLRTYRGNNLFIHNRTIKKDDVIMAHRLYRRRYKLPIVVVRDPRDIYVSFYHYERLYGRQNSDSPIGKHYQYDENRSVQDDFFEYLTAKLVGQSHPWFYYSQFLDAWLNRPGVCVIRYEDCLKDPRPQLIRMLRFLGEEIDLEKVEWTLNETSFTAITKKKYGESRQPGQQDNTKFHRKGVAGDWRNYFSVQSSKLLWAFEGASLLRLGYETDSTWIDELRRESGTNYLNNASYS